MTPNSDQPAPPLPTSPGQDPLALLVECAIDSFVEALMTLIWGNLIFDVIGGLVGEMVPSPPPGMSNSPALRKSRSLSGESWLGSDVHQLWILGALFFILNLRTRLANPLLKEAHRETRLHRIVQRLRRDGFSLLFKNAIGAMVAAWVASCVVHFSWPQMYLHWLFDTVAPVLNQWAKLIFSHAHVGEAQEWWTWWSDNQLKFSFWVLYLSAICDDLGIPNLKTIARFCWSRYRRLFTPLPPSSRHTA